MSEGRNAIKILRFLGLILSVSGFAIMLWPLQPASVLKIGLPGIVKLKPGESTFERTYAYYLDNTEITITMGLDPRMSYIFNISKVGDQWSYASSGYGHNVLSFKLPCRGVYEYNVQIYAERDEGTLHELEGGMSWNVKTSNVGGDIFFISICVTLSGVVLLGLCLLLEGIKHGK